MKRLEKRIKYKIPALVLTCILGIVLLTTLGLYHMEDMKDDNSTSNVTTDHMMVTAMGKDVTLSLEPIQGSSLVEKIPMSVQVTDGIIDDVIYPRPANIPSLREYEINKDTGVGIWYARNPESYITPNNDWVKYVASQLYVGKDGRMKYKNKPIPYVVGYDGNIVSWTDEPFFNNYVSDDKLFNSPANGDLWQNADYYLSHGLKGDCEDWAIGVVSMMLSGEMSVKENGSYIRQVIPAKAVIGYSGKSKDTWVEYEIYGQKYISSTGMEFNPDAGNYESITSFHTENDWGEFKPIYQFTNKNFGIYMKN
jgi:hypothetical protein